MTDFFNNLTKFLNFKKNEKNFKRIIFNENVNTFKYLEHIINLDKANTCVISLEDLKKKNNNNIKYYYFNNFFIVSILFIFLKIKYLYTSTPDLNNSFFRRSIYNKTKYIYIQHSPVSLCMVYKNNAFSNFNAIQVVNQNQYSDLLDINNFFKKKIKPIKSKYFFLKNISKKNKNFLLKKIDYLIAPTWNTDFYKLNLHNKVFKILKESSKTFVFRPHYMSIKNREFLLDDLNLEIECIDTKSEFSFENYDNLISDWSGIYLEFVILKKIKPILINSKMKIRNQNFKKFSSTPIELELRNLLSIQFNPNELDNLKKYISDDKKLVHHNSQILNIIKQKFY